MKLSFATILALALAVLLLASAFAFAQSPVYVNCTPISPNEYINCVTTTPRPTSTTIPFATTTLTPLPIPYITQVDPRATAFTLTLQVYGDYLPTPTQEVFGSPTPYITQYRVVVDNLRIRGDSSTSGRILVTLFTNARLSLIDATSFYNQGYMWVRVFEYWDGRSYLKGVPNWQALPQPAWVAIGAWNGIRLTSTYAQPN